MKQQFTTVPGVPEPTFVSRMTAPKPGMVQPNKSVPVGERVAKRYPWFSGLKQIVSGVANTETRIVRAGYGSAAFVNTSDRLVWVNELRMFALAPIGTVFSDPPFNWFQIANRMGLKVRHTDFELVSDWLPAGMLFTENNNIGAAARSNLCLTLPTPYYLQAGHPFRVRLRSTNPYSAAADYTFWMTLFGKDPRTNKPYELCKQVTIPYAAGASDATPQYVDVVFDENRDYPMRDMLLTHIGVEATPFVTTNRVYVYQYVSQLEFQFNAPEGPKWMDFADWIPMANLMDQSTTLLPHSIVIYKPETPILLAPSQQIDIDVKALVEMFYVVGQTQVFNMPLWVSLLGAQEQKGRS